MSIQNRYEFVYLFDVTNGNPNGDPDAGNMPRLDPESSKGLVTDVCLKRKIRNFIEMTEPNKHGYEIFVKERSVLNQQIERAYAESEELSKLFDAWLQYEKDKKKNPRPQISYEDLAQRWMCENFFDIRTFGAVLSTGKAGKEDGSEDKKEKSKLRKTAGQVRGPVQLAFAQSIDPIIPLEISITRVAVTSEEEKDKGKDTMMGRKHIVPYALYRVHGFISANLAAKTGFSDEDLQKLWQALQMMFEYDRSAARGEMAARKLIVFKHDSVLGSQPAHKLFERVTVARVNGESGSPAAAFSDYRININREGLQGVSIEELL
jgi:conserved hypothetical protein